MEEEIWKDVIGYEGLYKVSSLGRVKSLGNEKTRKEKILKSPLNSQGYLTVVLCNGITRRGKKVHSLVAVAFLNHVPNGHLLVIDHINGIKADNRASSLRIVTNRFNCTLGVRKNKDRLTSKYPGVYWDKNANKWRSRIDINGEQRHLGLFNNEIDASNAYQFALRKFLNQQ